MDSFLFRRHEHEKRLHKDEQVERLRRQKIAPMNDKKQELNKPIYRAAGYEQRFNALLQTASDQENEALDGYQRFGLSSKNPYQRFALGRHRDGQSTERTQALEKYKQTVNDLTDLGIKIEAYKGGMYFLASQNIDTYNVKGFHTVLRFYKTVYTEQMQEIISSGQVSPQDQEMLEEQIQASEDAASLAERRIGQWDRQIQAQITQGSESPPSRTIATAPEDVKQAIESFHQKVVDQLCFLIVWSEAGKARQDLQAQTSHLQEKREAISEAIDKHPFLGPVRQELNRLENSDDVSPSESSSNRLLQEHDIKEFFDYFHQVADTLENANALLVGKNIYTNADDRLQDDGTKARNKLEGMPRDLEGIPEKLNRAFEKADICSHREKISEVFKSIEDTLLYWASHSGEIRLSYNESQEIKSTLDSISKKYFDIDDIRTIGDIIGIRNIRNIRGNENFKCISDYMLQQCLLPTKVKEDLLGILKLRLSQMESDDRSLLRINERFLKHEREKLENFCSNCSELLKRWKAPEEGMKIAFGEDMYNRT